MRDEWKEPSCYRACFNEQKSVAVIPTAATLMDQYFSEDMMAKLVENSNTYIKLRQRNEPKKAA